ncbi:MAG: S41 family peptidase [Pirellulales bacterium]
MVGRWFGALVLVGAVGSMALAQPPRPQPGDSPGTPPKPAAKTTQIGQPDASKSQPAQPNDERPAADNPSEPKGVGRPPAAEDDQGGARREELELLQLFVDTLDQVQRNYVKDISRRELYEAAIRGLLTKLDQHSSYIPPDDIESFKGSVESEFGGIGIQVSLEGGRLIVISPLVGTPAYRAGIQAGDWISEINGQTTRDITLDEAVKRMKGKIGTTVRVTVVHARDGKSEALTLAREVVRVETVLGDRRRADDSWDFLLDHERKIGYIRLTSFGRHTPNELRKALQQLADQQVRALILDVRFNPGGLLSAAIDVSDLFVADGRIVSTVGRNVDEQVVYAKREGTYGDFPLVVLANQFSASASEIVAACLQDHERAIVVGERTWGKGSVQNIIELEGGRSALKLTTASYQRPNGRNIHRFEGAGEEDEWGVKPSPGYEVKLSVDELRGLIEQRRQRDIVGPQAAELPPLEQADKQLAKALEYLRGKLPEPRREPAADGKDKPAAPAGKPATPAEKPAAPPEKPAAPGDAAGKPPAPPR